MAGWNNADVTLPEIPVAALGETDGELGLTILFHPDTARIGETAIAGRSCGDRQFSLGRQSPLFCAATTGEEPRPLADRHISRTPILLSVARNGVELEVPAGSSTLRVAGRPVSGRCHLPRRQLAAGVVLQLARRVILYLHYLGQAATGPAPQDELVGNSSGLQRVRNLVERVAVTDVPVLLLGESGTGKELVARALHRRSGRASAPLVTVNMAAIPAELAASELFGVRRGAFTGADTDRAGYFQQAHGGTLFLDEIGACPSAVQPQLLRALQEGEIQLPGGGTRRVDVRVLAATDARLQGGSSEFSAALRHRLGGFEIHLPALRERREDLGRLLLHFLPRALLERIGDDPVALAQLSALVHDFARYDWPGNVRELKNYCEQIAIASGAGSRLVVPENILLALKREPPAADAGAPVRTARDISADEVRDALLAARWEVSRAARALGVSRPALYKRIESIPGLRVAASIPGSEVEAIYHECGGQLEQAAMRLQVSRTALRRRWRAMDLVAVDD